MGRRVARGKTSRLKWVVVCVEVFAAKPRKRHVDEKCGLTGGLQAAEMADAVMWQIATVFSRRHFACDQCDADTFCLVSRDALMPANPLGATRPPTATADAGR
jgi:hypothetical protein